MLTKVRKKQLDTDLWIIAGVSLLILVIYTVFGREIMCILIHGAVGVTPDAVAEMLCTIFLIYGMLIVRKATGNAWGCILIFVFYWNAL